MAIVLWSLDVVFISGDLLRHRGLLHDVRFAVTAERSYGEWYQYVKAAAVVLLLLRSRRQAAAAWAWAGLFAYLLLDDALALHEAFGRFLASAATLPRIGPVRPEQVGELFLYAIVGLAFTGAVTALLRRDDPASWRLSVVLMPPFAMLVFFGAVVDFFHSFLRDGAYRYAAGVIEDGGEMLAMSVLVAIAYWATRGGEQAAEENL